MAFVTVERLDHLGLPTEVIKDRRLIDRIDARLRPDSPEEITPGEAVAGMILNHLDTTGFALTGAYVACCVVGTNMDASQVSDAEVIRADKGQA